MRLLHTSDWHLGQYFYGKSRAHEHQQFLNWLLNTISDENIDIVIVAGDIFDTGTPPSYARELYFDFIEKLNKLDCQLVILAGNHDSVAMLSEAKGLLKSLNTQVVPVVSDDINQQVFTLSDKNNQPLAVVCAIPYIRPRDVLTSKAGQSARDKQLSLQQGIADHYQRLYQHAKTLADDKLPILATGHLTTVGVTVSESVRDIYIGTLEAFPADAFPPANYIALGHIHRSQKVAKSEHIRYSGSPIALSFDEAKQEKSVLIAEFEQERLSQVLPLTIPCFQPLIMVKTSLENVVEQVSQAVEQYQANHQQAPEQRIWLDIEISSAQYLQDLQMRIASLVENLPVEILLVRRAKTSRQAMPEQQEKVTLNELTLMDVFNARLAQEEWQDEQGEQKQRLEQLFLQMVAASKEEQA
ncbi:exonuclease subunit SbcD [Thalassotalea sp. PLHSN55]|uniref:exonuclease subunit SbcD n=1 Tax=Thalassotalea sp. PLHSN55 TaxID=3435888 RepID=UPI003F828174